MLSNQEIESNTSNKSRQQIDPLSNSVLPIKGTDVTIDALSNDVTIDALSNIVQRIKKHRFLL